MATLADITNANWSLALTTPNEVVQALADLEQCVGIIFATQQRSVRLDPDFGLDILAYIDRPTSEVIANLPREMKRQIEKYEPRVTVQKITPSVSTDGSQVTFEVTWTSNVGTGTNIFVV
ncbi:MAG: GPW/gp25 family protein [Betaproteobacteria bacterium]